MRNLLSLVGALALMGCGGDDDGADAPPPDRCNPIGRWFLETTFIAGDCAELGETVTDELVVADAGDVFLAQLVVGGGFIECEGQVDPSCAAELECLALLENDGTTSEALAGFAVQFDGDNAAGTGSLSVTGGTTCMSTGTVTGSR